MATKNILRATASLATLLAAAGVVRAAQPLETETARLPSAGAFVIESTAEYQRSSEGSESALPFAFEYGITDRLELLVEPVAYTRISPKRATGASGIGDLETTLTYRFHDETERSPALAAAFEVKIPTSHDELIGTGKTDYAGYLIASKRVGRTDLHFNLSYAAIGQANGAGNINTIGYAVAAEYSVSDRLQLVAEYVGQTSAGTDAGDGAPIPVPTAPDSAFAPEAGGAETFGMVGLRYQYADRWAFAFGISYDNNNAWLVRPGVTYNFR